MTRLATFVLIAIIGCSVALDAADARRVALVIGINDYAEVSDLEKAVGDANAMAATLESLGFDVTELVDVNRRELNQAISTFTASLSDGDTTFVHFSGHGVEIGGENYLLPADVPVPAPGQSEFIKSEAVAMSDLVSRIAQSGARTRVFVIDACRNNPFEQDGVRGVGGTRGLARVEAPAGTFIMYSAGYRQLALDRLGEDDNEDTSVYTRTLIQYLTTPGRAIDDVAQDVRREVEEMARSIGHDQRPAYYDELSARLILVEPTEAVVEQVVLTPPDTLPITRPVDESAQVWGTIQTTNSVAVLEAFIEQFPQSVYSRFAHARLQELGGSGGAREDDQVEIEEGPQTDGAELAERASELRRNGNFAEALDLARQAADLGDARGMFLVALAYDFGEGVTLDDVEGSHWYRRAADAGHSIAMYNLAWNYEHGEGVTQNGEQAVHWYRAAIEAGDEDAIVNLALMYENGSLVAQDYAEAKRLYERGVEAGNAKAMLYLGIMYDDGVGIAIDDNEAVRLFRLSSELGNSEGTYRLALMYDFGEGVALDDLEAARLYREAADAGHVRSMLNLGIMYDNGEGVAVDDVEAVRLFRQASEQGSSDATFRLALMYDFGEGVTLDDLEAARLYRQAAATGHARSMYYLGIMYETGEGVGTDRRVAASYVFDAIANGEEDATKQLVENSTGWSSQFRVEFQRLLHDHGIYDGALDGQFGPATRTAIEELASR